MRKVSGLTLPKPKQFYAMSASIAAERKADEEAGGEGEECGGI